MIAERRIKVDTEHFGVRFLLPIITIGVTLVFFVVSSTTLGAVADEGLNVHCITIPLSVLVLLGTAWLTERGLKRLMPSRRSAVLSADRLDVIDQRKKPTQVTRIDWGSTVNVQGWRFTVRRRTRVPKGWLCLAMQLLQDEEAVILYTFISPDDSKTMAGFDNFVRLRPRKETISNTDLNAIADQRRLLKLEDERWNDGAEIAVDDFRAVVEMVRQHVPGWN
ncbi:MAG TPA: hypothetical protein VHP83_12695 [Aggregatilineaceae bacterium]|nr:hypothetical protein [Aggregatilineaceae bacterium]